jgi:TatD DNase family protein
MWIDTHCHLDAAEFDADRDAMRAQARAQAVSLCVIPAVERAHWAGVAQLYSSFVCATSP